ncbi:MAG: glycoside hydrolase family 88 protein [Bacteroidota bacterium]
MANPAIITEDFWENAFRKSLKVIDANLPVFTSNFPAPCSKDNIYPAIDNVKWTSSFWTGMLWLAYEITGDLKYRQTAAKHLESYQKRIEGRIATDTHDLGFLYSLSCIAAYKLTGDEGAKRTALAAADLLITRYFEKPGIIQAWGDLTDKEQRGRMIIDCLMNLPLLYWAAGVTGDQKYAAYAYNHAKQSAKYLVREDASTYHTYFMDPVSGAPLLGKTCQGYSDDSCWSRGQAWAIYGFTLSYLYTKDCSFIELAQKLANYFLNRLPQDYVAYWDLVFTDGPEERDSSAAAIAVCGLLELVKHLATDDQYRMFYRNAALKILTSLVNQYSVRDSDHSNGLLLHAVYNKPKAEGVDECCIWGDYFYCEALVRMMKDWSLYW